MKFGMKYLEKHLGDSLHGLGINYLKYLRKKELSLG